MSGGSGNPNGGNRPNGNASGDRSNELRQILEALGYHNVWVRAANGTLGWPDEAPFDRILVAAGGPSVPPPLFEQLAEGGRMIMPVGDSTGQVLKLVEKTCGMMHTSEHAGCVFVKLVGKYAWEC